MSTSKTDCCSRSDSALQCARSTEGVVLNEFSIPTDGSDPIGVTVGADGNLWFTENFAPSIGKITPAGVITEYAISSGNNANRITSGADGNLWFTETSGIGESCSGDLFVEVLTGQFKGYVGDLNHEFDFHSLERVTNRAGISEVASLSRDALADVLTEPDVDFVWLHARSFSQFLRECIHCSDKFNGYVVDVIDARNPSKVDGAASCQSSSL
jgi:hypothetical protein